MKYLLSLTLLSATVASANTVASFKAVPDAICYNYCTQYSTDNALVKINYANLTVAAAYAPTPYMLTVRVNARYYSGTATSALWLTGVPVYAANGTYLKIKNLRWSTATTCVKSGRGQHCTTRRHVKGGTVVFPYM